MSNIVIGITSGIAAYKTLDLLKLLKKNGHTISVVMTKNATYIVNPKEIEKIIEKPVLIELFDKTFSYKQIIFEKKVQHIEIANNADIIVIAPATANTIAKCAYGIADNFLTTILLATHAPILFCPSMNSNMWNHLSTVKNINTLASYGYEIMTPDSGPLACGTEGVGRMPEVEKIFNKVNSILLTKRFLEGKKICITSGGTSEAIDDVRVITNKSSGKMGKAIAEAAHRYGAIVTFIHAINSAIPNIPIKKIPFQKTSELVEIIDKEILNCDIFFHTAAVSDFSVQKQKGKISSSKSHTLSLIPNEKVIERIKKINPKVLLIGFKATYGINKQSPYLIAQNIFKKAIADFVIVNDISRTDIGFGSDENEVYIVSKDKNIKKIQKASKTKIAQQIILEIFK